MEERAHLANPQRKPHRQTIFSPVALLPVLSKVFEEIVLNSTKKTFIHKFGKNQHAFHPHGSSTTVLPHIYDSITSFMENEGGLFVRVTCLDLVKLLISYNTIDPRFGIPQDSVLGPYLFVMSMSTRKKSSFRSTCMLVNSNANHPPSLA